jgi:hypothetical protein
MPLVDVPYGSGTLQAALPDETFFVPFAGGRKLTPLEDLEGSIREALAKPLGMPPLREIARPGMRVVVAFDDPTVPSYGPMRRLALTEVLRELESAGVRPEAMQFICANSLHRKFRPEELGLILGPSLVEKLGPRLFCHDAEDAENLVYLGKTPGGYEVELSRHAAEADLLVYINSAHYRGFAGGWKSICVGLSTFRSIRHHHTPDGMSMSVDDNPMHKMLEEMGRLTEERLPGTIFKIDAIEAGPFQTAAVFAGNIWETRKAAIELLREAYPPRRSLSDERFDVILYGVPDWSPYAIFSHMNPILTLISSGLGYLGGTIQALGKPECTVIMATPCPLQWDRVHHPSYEDVWNKVLSQTRDAYEIEAQYTEQYATHEVYIDQYRNAFGFHPVHGILGTHPLRRLKHCGRVIVAGIQDPAVARHLGFEAADSIETALAMATEIHGTGCSVAYATHPAAPTKIGM